MKINNMWTQTVVLAVAVVFAAAAQAGPTLDKVKQGGLVCGVPTGIPGFGMPDSQGKYSGLDVDVCKAVYHSHAVVLRVSNPLASRAYY